ncbi:unnamed protein product [Adineta steineri]|uniref:RRM domain-containing protein n=1 Tax=Adineta steineri TaxID=433720 RepID=A0A814JR75_9BILA|nr:unnamed protein product [Adineta steineri]CAF3892500.1 unnamed protein product [Adineta steineri]
MAFNDVNPPREGGNVWSAGSRGSRGGFARSDNNNNNNNYDDARGGGSYRGSYRGRGNGGGGGGGGFGFRRQDNNDEDEIEILKEAIFIQNLPKNITRDDIQEAFSTVGPIKTDERSGGPKIWIYKDRMTGEGNGRATVTYEDEETADKAISEYNDQHIGSINSVVRVQLAQRRIRNNDNRGFNNNRGFRGGRNNWNNDSRPGGNRWNGGRGGGFRGRGGGDRGGSYGGERGGSYGGDRGGSYGGSRGSSFRGNTRGNNNSTY